MLTLHIKQRIGGLTVAVQLISAPGPPIRLIDSRCKSYPKSKSALLQSTRTEMVNKNVMVVVGEVIRTF